MHRDGTSAYAPKTNGGSVFSLSFKELGLDRKRPCAHVRRDGPPLRFRSPDTVMGHLAG